VSNEELVRRENELYDAVSREVIGWDRYDGVVAAGLAFADDEQSLQPYFVRVYVGGLAMNGQISPPAGIPESLSVQLRGGGWVVLPVCVESTVRSNR
jgi:hypothetical protein